jgi:hypothetical protein
VPDEALTTSTSPVVGVPTIGVTADAPFPKAHTVSFSSVSNRTSFSSEQRRTTFSSVSNQLIITGTVDPLGFLLLEDGAKLLLENGQALALES